ncbi:DUF1800 domain-containing protein [Paucibacter sp. B2R-40]|uniref:DUF1800 domain-containing protein n=1 Tax=Paucibacter sp. B2R-40 TaxID=2893554 RepID=UPI0021E40C9F|nr:DUF1800 domain-containing protein [Paucibacter sp. B2R-40]MCV2353728.1 DUF1800 domain-containing protein [Paucibacter sp. B2R-40]
MRHLSLRPAPFRTGGRRPLGLATMALATLLLVACGGGGGAADSPAGPATTPAASPPPVATVLKPGSREEAMRFLMQASFGPTEASIAAVMDKGYEPWLDEQFAKPTSMHRLNWDASDAAVKALKATDAAGTREVLDSFYKVAITADDQLRQRVAYALSQIMVVSMAQDNVANQPRGVASYLDTLSANAFGNYRVLLEQVATHPTMGLYLSHLKNQKEDAKSGRVPDENFAREVMQLFSIGLVELNVDGSAKLDGGAPKPSYTADDIAGMAKVFTGFSWDGADTADGRFWGWCPDYCEADRGIKSMQGYSQFHSISEKKFLGKVVAAQTKADPAASLKAGLDALALHPNVGPFIGRQMIQRLVTSNPSPDYVTRVSKAFGAGDMKAMVKAILLDSEARDGALAAQPGYGKLQEPVLRLTAALRALGASSDSGAWLIGATDDPATQLGQSPLRSPSVFNFYRPGFIAPGSESGAAKLTMPELQLVQETSVAGYANFVKGGVASGFGQRGLDYKAARNDVQFELTGLVALAAKPADLVEQVSKQLLGARSNAALKAEMVAAVESVKLDALKADASNKKTVDDQSLNRAKLGVYLALVSPEYLVQK